MQSWLDQCFFFRATYSFYEFPFLFFFQHISDVINNMFNNRPWWLPCNRINKCGVFLWLWLLAIDIYNLWAVVNLRKRVTVFGTSSTLRRSRVNDKVKNSLSDPWSTSVAPIQKCEFGDSHARGGWLLTPDLNKVVPPPPDQFSL